MTTHYDFDGDPVATHPDDIDRTCVYCICQVCGSPILVDERRSSTWITTCFSCAVDGFYDRATAIVHGQHKGPDLVSLPSQVDGRSGYDR